MLQGATCGGSTTKIADDYVFDNIFARTATILNAEFATTGYLLGKTNAVTSLTINGMQSSNISGTVVSLKSDDSSVFLTGIVNGGGAAPQTLLDPAHLSAPLTDFSLGSMPSGREIQTTDLLRLSARLQRSWCASTRLPSTMVQMRRTPWESAQEVLPALALESRYQTGKTDAGA